MRTKTNRNIVKTVDFSKRKMKKLAYLEDDLLRNFLFILIILFLILFIFCVVNSSQQIVKASDNVRLNIGKYRNQELENKIKKMTADYPIDKMAYYISRQDEDVAAFLVAIAKKESNWGKRTPKLNGKECYNYWGFREKRTRMGSGGHTCFDNPRDAVATVSGRIKNLLAKGVDTPAEMVIWKCGYSCKSQNPQSVKKWIADIGLYYSKF